MVVDVLDVILLLAGQVVAIPLGWKLKSLIPRPVKKVGGHTREMFYVLCLMGWHGTHRIELTMEVTRNAQLYAAYIFGLGLRSQGKDRESMNLEFEIFWQEISS
jgi:hypothetical protein